MFAKVFECIYDGSLRKDWKALVVFQQLLILSDEKGFVDKTAEAISGRTSIPLEFIQYGLDELIKPDPDSRSTMEEGRRIVLINPSRLWGWRIVNHEIYRSLKTPEDLRDYWSGKKRESREMKALERFNRMKPKLAIMFKQAETICWRHTDEEKLIEICNRETAEAELIEITNYRPKAAQYFPRSLDSLLANWQRTLDHAHNPVNNVKKRVLRDNIYPEPTSE
jgi:hypothetical protein